MRQRYPQTRSAFTLIELLVVIAIIGILAAILLVGVIPALRKGPELQTTSDLRNLAIGLDQFKGKFGVSFYPPSKITLCSDLTVLAKVDPVSLSYLTAIWPRLGQNLAASEALDWAGTGMGANTPKTVYTLEGDQCLVFFLGGIPDPNVPGVLGFSSNPANPTNLAVGEKFSFYQFDNARLFARAGSKFYSYQDPWAMGQPYAYFSSNKTKDGYNPAPGPGPGGDCPSLMPKGPYYQAGTNPIRYVESTKFQIISAGRDGLFGPGGAWSPANAAMIVNAGQDDQASFYSFKLGVSQ